MAAKKKARKSASTKRGARKGGAPAAGTKAAFVLSLPADTSAKDVVAKAKEEGIEISEAHVYTIRSSAKRGPAKPKGARAKKGPRAKASAENGVAATNKAEFVRSLPPGTSYADAADQAKAVGIQLSKAYYYVLKSEQKKKGSTASAPKGRTVARRGGRPKATLTTLPNGLMLTSRDPHEKAVLEAVEALGAERVRSVITAAERLQSA